MSITCHQANKPVKKKHDLHTISMLLSEFRGTDLCGQYVKNEEKKKKTKKKRKKEKKKKRKKEKKKKKMKKRSDFFMMKLSKNNM